MSLLLTEDEQLLYDSAISFVTEQAPVARFRAMRDRGETFDEALWNELVELGWPGLVGMGLPEVAVVMEALGTELVPTPLISTVMASRLDPDCGADEGRVVAVVTGIDVRDGALHGTARHVLDAPSAALFVVVTDDGLFRVDASEVRVQRIVRMDFRDAGHVTFEGATGAALEPASWSEAQAWGTVAIAAEMLGSLQAVFDRTLAWLKEREQFGVKIGSFQVLKHRAVDCFVEVELARSAVRAAAREPTPAAVALAKVYANEALLHVAKEAVQIHGGIGMTDESDVGFFLKRAIVASQVLGTSAHHRDVWARAHGY